MLGEEKEGDIRLRWFPLFLFYLLFLFSFPYLQSVSIHSKLALSLLKAFCVL